MAYQLVVARAVGMAWARCAFSCKESFAHADTPSWGVWRAFRLERLMDTLGAIGGPITAPICWKKTGHDFRKVFCDGHSWTRRRALFLAVCARAAHRAKRQKTLLLGIARAAGGISQISSGGSGVFGAEDFSHSLLILYASRYADSGSRGGVGGDARGALTLCIIVFRLLLPISAAGLSDHISHRRPLLAGSYGLAVATALLLCTGTGSLIWLGVIFILAGTYAGSKDALEDVVAASCAPKEQHGMAFGTLAAGECARRFLRRVCWLARCGVRSTWKRIRSLRRALSGGGNF